MAVFVVSMSIASVTHRRANGINIFSYLNMTEKSIQTFILQIVSRVYRMCGHTKTAKLHTFRLFNLFSEIFCLLIVSGYGYGYTSREKWISQQQNEDKHRVITIKLFVRPILKYFVNICHITIKMFALRLEQNSTIFEALVAIDAIVNLSWNNKRKKL